MSSEVVDFELEALRIELREIGATPVQRQVLEQDVDRARAAITEAYERGAGNVASYAMSLFKSDTFRPGPRSKPALTNVHGKVDTTRTDDGERIWQAHEVDNQWRRGYLADCIQALDEGRDPAARYAPSQDEFARLTEVAQSQEVTHDGARRALAGWARVWGFSDLELQPQRALDEPVPF